MRRISSKQMTPVHTFVVRIYRSGEADSSGLLGTVQWSGADVATPFASPQELIRLLGDHALSWQQDSGEKSTAPRRQS